MQYIQACLLTKQNLFLCDDAGLEHMAAWSRGNGTNFDWLRKSCDISTCDLSFSGNPEKYGRLMKSAIQASSFDTVFVVFICIIFLLLCKYCLDLVLDILGPCYTADGRKP